MSSVPMTGGARGGGVRGPEGAGGSRDTAAMLPAGAANASVGVRADTSESGACNGALAGCSKPLAALIAYSFTYFVAFGMLVVPAPMVFNDVVNGSPDAVSSRSSFALGVWGVVNMTAQFLMARFWGEISDQHGRRVCLLTSAVGTAALHWTCALSSTLWPLFVAIVIEGGTSTAYSASQGYISDVSNTNSMGANFGLYFGLAVGGGFAVGVPLSVVALTASGGNPHVSFAVSGTIVALGGVGAYFGVPESLPRAKRRPVVWRSANPLGAFRLAWRNAYITGLVLVYVLLALARGGTQAIWINYVTLRWGWSPTLSAVFFILVGCGMALYPRLLIPRFGEEACLQAGCVISIVNSVLVGLDPTGWVVFVTQPLLMSGDVVYPAILALLAKQVSRVEQGAMQGTADSVRTLSMGAGAYFVSSVFAYYIEAGDEHADPATAPPYVPGAGMFAVAAMYMLALGLAVATRRVFGHLAVDLAPGSESGASGVAPRLRSQA